MATTATVHFRWDRAAIKALKTYEPVKAEIQRAAEGMADQIQANTPRHTGAGAASIGVHPAPRAVGAFDAGWDKTHYYLGFPEYGTKYQAAQGFARRVLQHYIHT